jgi:Fe-S-cluster containining protein
MRSNPSRRRRHSRARIQIRIGASKGKEQSVLFWQLKTEAAAPVMKKISRNHKPKLSPCLTFACADECCTYGADVEIEEYQKLIENNLAAPGEFTGPEEDEGVMLYRTALGPRGCTFLLPERGCRLHNTPFKPRVCLVFPRDTAEAKEAYEDGYLPCVGEELAALAVRHREKRSGAREKSPA